ncbi:hypothetical protein T4D_4282 [Trichinella pseudospiralis]|uniref:Uncharacterized protein n=1 Tax=Trichinella pseudospiralis TaxID=6337 RepID=A0A0V1FLZ9_TRIPS|nr:hypothetical protein T4D_4282 [Trichinella pseudospiralis]
MFLALLAVASSENSNNMNIQHVFWHRRNGKESHHITDPRRIALDNKVKAALECKHLVFAIELEWSLEIQITDLEVLFSLPMASKGTTRDLMVVRNNVEQIVGDTHLRVPCSIEHSLTRAELSTFTQCIDVPKLKARQQFRAISSSPWSKYHQLQVIMRLPAGCATCSLHCRPLN